MLLKSFFLTCLLFVNVLIQSTTCALPSNIQNLELDDITSLWDKLPSIIDKIKEAVSRFRCPKGWKRLGGSCYYLSNLTSTSIDANYTCNLIHSNLSNLMQIRNTVELFYAAHVLTKNNLSSLIIDVESSLLRGRNISEMLMNDPDRWKRMKKNFNEVRVKYQKLKKKIVDRLTSTGLRILRRSKKVKEIPTRRRIGHDETHSGYYEEYDFDDRELNITNYPIEDTSTRNLSSINDEDEYEYDDLDSPDESDLFEQIDDIRGICQKIDWNVHDDNSNSTVYILTTYIVSDQTVCSLSDVEIDTEYHHVCEYVLDFCFANIMCGKHGQCVNTLAGFQCSCSFLYGGVLCDKISEHGQQIVIGLIIIGILTALTLKPVRVVLWFITNTLIKFCKRFREERKQTKQRNADETQNLVDTSRSGNDNRPTTMNQSSERRPTLVQELMEFLRQIYRCITSPKPSNPLKRPIKRNLVRTIWVGLLNIFFSSILFISTSLMYLVSFGYNMNEDHDEEFSINDTIRLVNQCVNISDYRTGNLIFAPFALSLILIFSWSLKREKYCLNMCDGRPALITPIEPFRTGNRFTTATVFGILAFEVLKIFEDLLFRTGQPLHQGVLIELFERIALVILVGLRYYPVLASLQLRNIVARGFTCIYIICDMMYTIIREGSCMGFLPLSGQYTAAEEAKLRKELGTWFIVYGLIKNIPHFFLLSYISAELCVRFIYDSIYVPYRKQRSIWSAPIAQLDECEFSKYYVTKLLRRNRRFQQISLGQNEKTNLDNLIDHEHEAQMQNTLNQSRVKRFFDCIYHSDDDFRFTTIATCTYTVAVVFLYYLACTFVFLYLSRTAGHISFLKFYIESTFNVELGAFSLKLEIILSAVFTVIIYGFQLFIGMQNYKKHKSQLYKGIYVDVPSAMNFKPSSMASNSVHYSGFLVGYMAWGFVICFHLILFILIGLKIVSLQIRHIELVLAIVVPVLVIYFLKMLSMRSAGKFLFIQKMDDKLNLKSRKMYAMFVYFSFFADCFLGIASCIIRLIKATFLNVVFMARLDWSFLGRPLERFDLGFAAYISYLHMEVTYTNPVMLAFCYSLFDDIVQRRPKHCYDDECCIAPGELDEDYIEPPKQSLVKKNESTVQYKRKKQIDMSIEESLLNQTSPRSEKQRPQSVRIVGKTTDTELPTVSIISNKSSQKRTRDRIQQNRHVVIKNEENSQSDCPPEVPRRADLSSEKGESEIDDQQLRLTAVTRTAEINVDNPSDDDDDDQHNDKSEQKLLPKSKKIQSSKEKKKKIKHNAKQRGVHNQITKEKSSSENSDNDHVKQSIQNQGNMRLSSSSYNTINELAPKLLDTVANKNQRKKADQHHITRVQKSVACCPPPYNLAADPKDLHLLRTTSYRQAHHSTPPLLTCRSDKSSKSHNHKNINSGDDNNHYAEIGTSTIQPTTNSYSCSKLTMKKASFDHSNKQKQDEDSDIEIESDDDDDDNDDDDDKQEVYLLKARQTTYMNQSTIVSTDNISTKSEKDILNEKIKKRKRLRFRWHFLYTLIRNYHLFDLRKDVEGRLTRLHLQRSSLIDEQQLPSPILIRQPEVCMAVAQMDNARTEAERISSERVSLTDIPTEVEHQPSSPRRLFSVPVPVTTEYPPSPAERYIAIRAQMLYDTNVQQINGSHASTSSHTPTTAMSLNRQRSVPVTTYFSDRSLGFRTTPDIIIQPPSESSTKSERTQITDHQTPRIRRQEQFPPTTFLPDSPSIQSTADYPLATTSMTNSSTFRTQMSHDQHMQVWRQDEMEKIQKKQRHCYIYGPPPQTPLQDKVSRTAILTPQLLSTVTRQQQAPSTADNDATQRQPTISPFQFPDLSRQVRTTSSSTASDTVTRDNNQQSTKKHRQKTSPIPPPRMDRLVEDPHETNNKNISSKTIISAQIHQEDSSSDTSDIKND
ncbi:hypothetical protein I4U23_030039 [Adineta vaga]|nr:hypothetical protein I4U23_030039 [Adineta vaga]